MSEGPTRILVSIDWYLPGFKAGGPIRSVANLVEALGGDFHFSIFTSNTDYGEKEGYADIETDTWVELSPHCRVWYSSREKRSYRHIRTLIRDTEYDMLYLNSMFSLKFTLFPLWNSRSQKPEVPVILAPRGMLHPGALGLKSRKKKLFLWLLRMIGVQKHVTFQATDPAEIEHIRGVFGEKAEIVEVPNLPRMDALAFQPAEKKSGALRMVFLSRISAKKGVLLLLEALEKQTAHIELDLYGPDEEAGYWAACEAIIARLPKNVTVRKLAPVPPSETLSLLQGYHLFAMPTKGENFGHAIFEALSAGIPVLISDQTPWRGLAEKGVGADLVLDGPGGFAEVIAAYAEMNAEEWRQNAEASWAYARDFREGHEGRSKSAKMFIDAKNSD
ncbi:MAG: glycosyltransferase [Bacteroidota bacterium]